MVSEAPASKDSATTDGAHRPKILYLGGAHDALVDLQKRLGPEVEVVKLSSSSKALALVSKDEYAGVYVDADRFAEANDVGRFLQNDRILRGMPEAVVLLDSENTILWGNGRLAQWTKQEDVAGKNFYQVLGGPEILGPDFCPLHTAHSTLAPSHSILRSADGKYYRLHAAPAIEADHESHRLIVTIHDITAEMLQQQKLAAIHQAGIELADLVPEDVSNLDYNERWVE